MGALVAAGRLDLNKVGEMVLAARDPGEEEPAAPGEETELIDSGVGLAVLAACLRQVAAEGGEAAMAAAWRATGHRVALFVPEVRSHKRTASEGKVLPIWLTANALQRGMSGASTDV